MKEYNGQSELTAYTLEYAIALLLGMVLATLAGLQLIILTVIF